MRRILILLSLISLGFLTGTRVAAQEASPSQNRRQEVRQNLCDKVTERLADRREHFQNLRERRANIYRGVIHRLTQLADRLDSRGCNSAKLRTDLTTWQGLIDELVTAFNLFLDKLQAVGIPVCQTQPQDHRAALAAVKDQLTTVKQVQRAVRDFYKNTIKPDVKDLKQTCRATASPTTTPQEAE